MLKWQGALSCASPYGPGLRQCLAVHASGYVRALTELGYTDRTIQTHMEMLGHLSHWLEDGGLGLEELTDGRGAEFLAVRGHRGDRGLVTGAPSVPVRYVGDARSWSPSARMNRA